MSCSRKVLSYFLSAVLAVAFVPAAAFVSPQEASAAGAPSVSVTRAATGKLVMKKGSSYKLAAKATAGKLTYKSAKPKVVSVSKKGVLKAKKAGKATVTVTAKSGAKKAAKKVKVTVVAAKKFEKVKKLTATASATALKVGQAAKVKVGFKPKNASNKNVTFKSSAPAVLSVSDNGTVTAKKAGSAKVTVTSCDNAKAKASVAFTVSAAANGGSVTPAPAPAKPKLENLYASPQNFVEGSEDARSLLTVDASGVSSVSLRAGARTLAMNDSGADGDAEAGDGIWSATVDFTGLSAGESAECTATAAGLTAGPLTVTAFPQWSEELEARSEEQAQAANDAVGAAIAPYVDDESGYVETEEDFEAAHAGLEQALKGLVEDGAAVSYEMTATGGNVKLASGPRCLYELPIEGLRASGDDVKVEFWCTELINGDPTEGLTLDKRLEGEDEVTCKAIVEQMPQNSVVWWYGHGSWTGNAGSVLLLTERYQHALFEMGWCDAVSDKFCMWMDDSETEIHSTGNIVFSARAAVSAGFFDKYKPDMTGDVFLASVCCGAVDGRLANAMKRRGCKGYFGYTDTVTTQYNNPFSNALVKCLMRGYTLGGAYEHSMSMYGDTEYDYFINTGNLLTGLGRALIEKTICKPRVIYGSDYSLKNEATVITGVLDHNTISLSDRTSAAIKSDGSLWTWGHNYFSQLGDGTTIRRVFPVKIMDGAVSVTMDVTSGAAFKSDGSLWTWGRNEYGQLGDGTMTNRTTPVRSMGGVVSAWVSDASAVIKSDGSLWTWGWNELGQLGDGTTADRTTPAKVMDSVVSVANGGVNFAAIKSDGSLWMWGLNDSGQLGDGTTEDRYAPVKIMDDVVSVSLGQGHSAAVKSDGSLWTWGLNACGQLGDGTTEDRYTPVKVMDGVVSADAKSVQHTAAIKSDGSLWTWGCNDDGQLGDGTTEERHVPVKIMDDVVSVSLGGSHSGALKSDGSLWTWGNNESGQLGDGTTTSRTAPVKVMDGVRVN